MHSLSFKVFTDSNTASRRCLSGGGGISSNGFVAVPVWPGCRDIGRLTRSCRIVACAPERNGGGAGEKQSSGSGSGPIPTPTPSSLLSRSQTYALLKQQMEVAAKSEDYKEAARIRDSLKSFEAEEPILRLRRSIKEAIADERFEGFHCLVVNPEHFFVTCAGLFEFGGWIECVLHEDAARYRDELKEIAPHSLLKCSSDATTLGIRVQVRSVYIEGRSQPSKGQYFFAYRIRITNNSNRPVQLLRRHWIISDANGKTENFWGVGVIGEQPVILPQTGFEYSSACPLSTPNGRMEGDFEMKHIDKVGSQTFNVAIAPFSLAILGDEMDTFES